MQYGINIQYFSRVIGMKKAAEDAVQSDTSEGKENPEEAEKQEEAEEQQAADNVEASQEQTEEAAE